MEPRKLQETHRINKAVVQSYSLLTIILQIAYILEFVKGSRTLGYTVLFAIFNLCPYITCLLFYLKNKESSRVKYVFCIGFSILYVFVLLTAAVPTTFVYIFLIFALLIPYGDTRLCIIAGVLATLANIVSVVIGFGNGSLTSADLAMVEIQVIAVALSAYFSALATSVIGKVNAQRIAELNEEKEKSDTLLANTLTLSKGISEDIASVTTQMELLERSVATTKDSMQDVTSGANETAESMQAQLLQTEEIVEQVSKAEEVTRIIVEDIHHTEETILIGKTNIENLLVSVKESEAAGSIVAAKMSELTENTEKMNSIVEMIDSVTKQTSLLSLNASIEAARAGEAGRGFAVVAEEISTLAKQTSSATINITKLIEEITLSINEAYAAIKGLVDGNVAQNQSVETMAKNFEQIEASSRNIYVASDDLATAVEKLAVSNASIVDSINNVSSVTQEVSARANETFSESENNALVVEEITKLIKELNDKAKQLNQ